MHATPLSQPSTWANIHVSQAPLWYLCWPCWAAPSGIIHLSKTHTVLPLSHRAHRAHRAIHMSQFFPRVVVCVFSRVSSPTAQVMGWMLYICKVVDALKRGCQGHKALVGNQSGLPCPSDRARPTALSDHDRPAFDWHPRLPLQYNFAHTLSHV